MRSLVRSLQQKLKITTVFVTHDQTEAVSIADRIAFINAGQIEQFALPRDFFTEPETIAAAKFFGWKTCAGIRRGDLIETIVGEFLLPENTLPDCERIFVGFHPSNIKLVNDVDNAKPNLLRAKLVQAVDLGTRQRYIVKLSDNETIEIETTSEFPYKQILCPNFKEPLALKIAPEKIRLFV